MTFRIPDEIKACRLRQSVFVDGASLQETNRDAILNEASMQLREGLLHAISRNCVKSATFQGLRDNRIDLDVYVLPVDYLNKLVSEAIDAGRRHAQDMLMMGGFK